MTTFPGSPRLVRGALVAVDMFNPLASVIIFQYNPATMTRRLEAQTAEPEGSDRAEVLRLKGAPRETISLEIEIDATDQLEKANDIAVQMGIYPQLSALEMMLYPKSAVVIANTILAATGTIEVIAPEVPLTLFIWGPKRILPVRLTGFSITEEAFDVQLNPTMAKVPLELMALNYDDFPLLHPGRALFLAHQVAKEAMATLGSTGKLADVIAGGINRILGG
jgi:hypothetical protein